MKTKDKLRSYWSKKENDLMYAYPAGEDVRCDSRLMHSVFSGKQCSPDFSSPLKVKFDPSFIEELERRGYDIATFRFSIEPKKGNQKFCSQRPPESPSSTTAP